MLLAVLIKQWREKVTARTIIAHEAEQLSSRFVHDLPAHNAVPTSLLGTSAGELLERKEWTRLFYLLRGLPPRYIPVATTRMVDWIAHYFTLVQLTFLPVNFFVPGICLPAS